MASRKLRSQGPRETVVPIETPKSPEVKSPTRRSNRKHVPTFECIESIVSKLEIDELKQARKKNVNVTETAKKPVVPPLPLPSPSPSASPTSFASSSPLPAMPDIEIRPVSNGEFRAFKVMTKKKIADAKLAWKLKQIKAQATIKRVFIPRSERNANPPASPVTSAAKQKKTVPVKAARIRPIPPAVPTVAPADVKKGKKKTPAAPSAVVDINDQLPAVDPAERVLRTHSNPVPREDLVKLAKSPFKHALINQSIVMNANSEEEANAILERAAPRAAGKRKKPVAAKAKKAAAKPARVIKPKPAEKDGKKGGNIKTKPKTKPKTNVVPIAKGKNEKNANGKTKVAKKK